MSRIRAGRPGGRRRAADGRRPCRSSPGSTRRGRPVARPGSIAFAISNACVRLRSALLVPPQNPPTSEQGDHGVPDAPAREHRRPERGHRAGTAGTSPPRTGFRRSCPSSRATRGRARASRSAIPISGRMPGRVQRSIVDVAGIDARANTASSDHEQQRPSDRMGVATERLHRFGRLLNGLTTAPHGVPVCRGLAEERRQPGEERERADADRADRPPRGPAGPSRPRTREPEQPGPDDGDQRERPVVRVEEQSGDRP